MNMRNFIYKNMYAVTKEYGGEIFWRFLPSQREYFGAHIFFGGFC